MAEDDAKPPTGGENPSTDEERAQRTARLRAARERMRNNDAAPLTREIVTAMSRQVLVGLHEGRALQLVDYQFTNPLVGEAGKKPMATVFLPPTEGELLTITSAITIAARGENRAIRDGLDKFIETLQKLDTTEAGAPDRMKRVVELLGEFKQEMRNRWRDDDSFGEFTLAE